MFESSLWVIKLRPNIELSISREFGRCFDRMISLRCNMLFHHAFIKQNKCSSNGKEYNGIFCIAETKTNEQAGVNE